MRRETDYVSNHGGLNLGKTAKTERRIEEDALKVVLTWRGNELDVGDEGKEDMLISTCKMLTVTLCQRHDPKSKTHPSSKWKLSLWEIFWTWLPLPSKKWWFSQELWGPRKVEYGQVASSQCFKPSTSNPWLACWLSSPINRNHLHYVFLSVFLSCFLSLFFLSLSLLYIQFTAFLVEDHKINTYWRHRSEEVASSVGKQAVAPPQVAFELNPNSWSFNHLSTLLVLCGRLSPYNSLYKQKSICLLCYDLKHRCIFHVWFTIPWCLVLTSNLTGSRITMKTNFWSFLWGAT